LSIVVVRSTRRSTRPPCLSSVVAASDSPAARRGPQGGKGRPEGGHDVGLQGRLVVVDLQQVVAAGGDHPLAEVPLAERGVAGDHPAPQDHRLEQRQGRLVLVGLGRDAGLGQDAAGPLVEGRQQVDGRGVGRAAAARHLAVEGHGPQVVGRRRPEQVGRPAGKRRLEGVGVEPGEQGLERPEGGGGAAVAEPVHQRDRLVAAPLGDRGIAAATAEDRAAGVRQHRHQVVAAAVPRARVGHLGQEREQAAGRWVAHRRRIMAGGDTSLLQVE
jgi:hypothetical protein